MSCCSQRRPALTVKCFPKFQESFMKLVKYLPVLCVMPLLKVPRVSARKTRWSKLVPFA